MSSEYVVVLSTAPSAEVAARIARELVESRLAACVNVVPNVRSIYRWEGAVCDEAEVMCVIKTRRDRFEALRERLCASHPYDIPEVVALEVAGGHVPYLGWIDASLGTGGVPGSSVK